MARPRKDAQAEAVQETQVEEVKQEVEQAQAEAVQLVPMVLHQDFPGKARTANVHPNEVENMLPYGWRVKE